MRCTTDGSYAPRRALQSQVSLGSISCWLGCCIAAILWLQSAASAGTSAYAAQDAGQEESDLDRFLRLARTGSPVVRPQAAERLVDLGEPAGQKLLIAAGIGNAGLAALGKDLIEVMGRFGLPKLRKRLWGALADRDFPWRPAAARSLAGTAKASEATRFSAMLVDMLSPVRVAALQAFEVLDLSAKKARVEVMLTDPDDRVRRQAARLLDSWGEPWALAWLLEDLHRTDRFFTLRTGQTARYEAFRILVKRLGERFDYNPGREPSDESNVRALKTITAKVHELIGDELRELPHIARAGHATTGDVLGLELRSCRRGEYYLRWNAADILYVGTGNAVALKLPAGTVAALSKTLTPLFFSLGRDVFWGTPGCDLEQYHWLPDGAKRSRTVIVSKGPEARAGLRPEALGNIASQLLASIPEQGEQEDPRTHALRQRVRAALAAIGGALPTER